MTNFRQGRFLFCCAIFTAMSFLTSGNDALAGDDLSSGQNYYAGLNCSQLWYERNRIFATYGYCFKSREAINAFGPACFPPYGKLPSNLRSVVKEIKAWERRRGCQ